MLSHFIKSSPETRLESCIYKTNILVSEFGPAMPAFKNCVVCDRRIEVWQLKSHQVKHTPKKILIFFFFLERKSNKSLIKYLQKQHLQDDELVFSNDPKEVSFKPKS